MPKVPVSPWVRLFLEGVAMSESQTRNKKSRKAISKRIRFSVFERDGFKCAYCGATPETKMLRVDHVNPVANGGSDSFENLITSCHDCNAGKSDSVLGTREFNDGLAREQECRELEYAARIASECERHILATRQSIINFWCEITGDESMNRGHCSLVFNASREHGIDQVFRWLDIAKTQCVGVSKYGPSDTEIIKYFCGIKRKVEVENEQD